MDSCGRWLALDYALNGLLPRGAITSFPAMDIRHRPNYHSKSISNDQSEPIRRNGSHWAMDFCGRWLALAWLAMDHGPHWLGPLWSMVLMVHGTPLVYD